MNLIKKTLVAQAAVLAFWAMGVQAGANEVIAERLAPVGQVCVAGDEACGSGGAGGGAARSADDIVNGFCGSCHGVGVLGAPKTGDTADWQARADERGGLDALLTSAIEGRNSMPPKGMCGDCSDDELMGAIKQMSGL